MQNSMFSGRVASAPTKTGNGDKAVTKYSFIVDEFEFGAPGKATRDHLAETAGA